jgi:hypothetical protein
MGGLQQAKIPSRGIIVSHIPSKENFNLQSLSFKKLKTIQSNQRLNSIVVADDQLNQPRQPYKPIFT